MKIKLFALLIVLLVTLSLFVMAESELDLSEREFDGFIVKLKPGIDFDDKDFKKLGIEEHKKALKNLDKRGSNKEVEKRKDYFRKRGLDRLHVVSGKDYKNFKKLRKHPGVEYVYPNWIYTLALVPNDPLFSDQYGLHNTGQEGGVVDADIDAVEAWNIETGSESVVVAVVDTGIDYTHEDLSSNIWINENEIAGNGIDDDSNGFIDDVRGWDFVNENNDPMDVEDHGTHVAGILGAVGDNNIGVTGVSWSSKIIPVKVFQGITGSESNIIEGLEYATLNGADIISNSWGGSQSYAMSEVIDAIEEAGILLVFAAGNSGNRIGDFPARVRNDNVIGVAATDRNDQLASFSNYNSKNIDLAAPGDIIWSTIPLATCGPCGGYINFSGTSMATPFVSGLAVLIKSHFPSSDYLDLKYRLMANVDVLASLQDKVVTNGRLNAFSSLNSDSSPPSKITDLQAASTTFSSVSLSWTAGDDGNNATTSFYELRYSDQPITESNFVAATKIRMEDMFNPSAPGVGENFEVKGLNLNTQYYFAIKAVDNAANKGEISNVLSASTKPSFAYFDDDVESEGYGWSFDGLWHLETFKSFSPTTSWTYNHGPPDYDYVGISEGFLETPEIDLTCAQEALLKFESYFEKFAYNSDFTTIQISFNEGPFVTIYDLEDEYGLAKWDAKFVDISDYVGGKVKIRFKFSTFSFIIPLLNEFWGWSVDDIEVVGDECPFEIGDVNEDDQVSAFDALIIQSFVAGNNVPFDVRLSNSDVTFDNHITQDDANKVLDCSVGKYSCNTPQHEHGVEVGKLVYVGDVNRDGSIQSADALQILAFTQGSSTSNFVYAANADANLDGVITTSDAFHVLGCVTGSQICDTRQVEYFDII